MKRVIYARKWPVVILKNSGAVSLAFGRAVYRDTRWVVSGEVFKVPSRGSNRLDLNPPWPQSPSHDHPARWI